MSRRAPRSSSAVLLTRGGGRGFEVYLVLRSRTMRFMGGFWALPGGNVSEDDVVPGFDGADGSLRACALRELFEEASVLVPPLALAGDRARLRRALLARDASALAAWRDAMARDGTAAAASLEPIARLTTPPFAPVRYAAAFFHRALPPGAAPEPDRSEVEDGRFLAPAEWLAAWRRGEVLIAPPVIFVLERLAKSGDLAPGLDRVRADATDLERSNHLHRVRFTPGITVFPLETATLPPATTTNVFLVGEKRFFVVDPAPTDSEETRRFLAAIDERLEAGDEPAGILLTHHHPDHVGAVSAVREKLRVPVLAHPLTLERTPAVGAAARAIADGERFDLGRAPDGRASWTLTAVHTPGHDRGHMSFVEDRYRTAIAGDLVSTVSTIVIDPPEGHLATYLASLNRLLALRPGLVFPSHGLPRRDGEELLREYIAHRKEREEALVAGLKEGLSTVDALLPRVYPEADPAVYPLASRSLLAGLEKLAEEGIARSRDGKKWVLSG